MTTYKIKRSKKIPPNYFQEQELKRARKKYHNHLPFWEVSKQSSKMMANTQQQIHREGKIVYYKENIAKVRKVTRKGLWIEPLVKPNKKGIAYPSGKVIFIPEKEVEKHIYPLSPRVPFYFSPPVMLDF